MMYVKSRRLRRWPRQPADRGSMSLWLAIFAVAVLVLLAYIVDGGQLLNAKERAQDIAEQAARAGADQVSVAALRQGNFTIPPGAACQAADNLVSSYRNGALSASEALTTKATACSVDQATNTVTVTVSVTVNPVIPVIFGTFTTGATGSATLQCGNAVALTGAC
jgi:Flp pilus assembly protein TadG